MGPLELRLQHQLQPRSRLRPGSQSLALNHRALPLFAGV